MRPFVQLMLGMTVTLGPSFAHPQGTGKARLGVGDSLRTNEFLHSAGNRAFGSATASSSSTRGRRRLAIAGAAAVRSAL